MLLLQENKRRKKQIDALSVSALFNKYSGEKLTRLMGYFHRFRHIKEL